MVRGRLYIPGDSVRMWRSCSVPVDDLRTPEIDVNVLHKAQMIKSHAVQDADAIKSASRRHDINFLNDVSNKLAAASQPRPFSYREATPVYSTRYVVPQPVPSDYRRRTLYAAPVSDYEVTNYLAGGPLPYRRSYRGASVPPVSHSSTYSYQAPTPVGSYRSTSVPRAPAYGRVVVTPYVPSYYKSPAPQTNNHVTNNHYVPYRPSRYSYAPQRFGVNIVAASVVEKFSQLKDKITDSVIIGDGYASLRNQIENRILYLKSPIATSRNNLLSKRRAITDRSEGDENDSGTVSRKKVFRDGYGCVDFLAIIPLMMAYFSEDEEILFRGYEPASGSSVSHYRHASLPRIPAYKSLYDDVDEILSTPSRHLTSRKYGHSEDLDVEWPSVRPLSTLKGRAQSVQRQLDGIPEHLVYTPSRVRAASTVPTYTPAPLPPRAPVSSAPYSGGSSSSTGSLPSAPKKASRPPVSDARRKVRELLCRSKNDPRYYDGC